MKGGGIHSRDEGSTVTLRHSTVSGNTAKYGGGIYSHDDADPLRLEQSTVAFNTATRLNEGGGIRSPSSIELSGSLIAGNVSGPSDEPDQIRGPVMEISDNLISEESDVTAILEATLADRGGPTLTHNLAPGSPAILTEGDCAHTTDQRGYPRIGGCDRGAVEWQEFAIAIIEPVTRPVEQGQALHLDGSRSYSVEGTITSYAWSVLVAPEGSTASFNDPTLPKPLLTPDMGGDYTLQLIVTDEDGNISAPVTVTVSVVSKFTLTVTVAGGGTVTSAVDEVADNQIVCEPTCEGSYLAGTVVTLWASPNPGLRFAGWGGALRFFRRAGHDGWG